MVACRRDLYEEEDDLFCMGRAWGASRVGIFSFRRYDPRFPGGAGPLARAADRAAAMTYRASKTLTHELGHCFLLDHCIVYECLMNGTANLAEDDGRWVSVPRCLSMPHFDLGSASSLRDVCRSASAMQHAASTHPGYRGPRQLPQAACARWTCRSYSTVAASTSWHDTTPCAQCTKSYPIFAQRPSLLPNGSRLSRQRDHGEQTRERWSLRCE